MTKDEALNLALDALKTLMIERGSIYDKAITAIREALAQPEQEPVACVTYKEVADTMNGLWGGTLVQRQIAEELENTMLYTTSPQRTWVGLTDIDYAGLPLEQVGLVRWAEAKLKEKNT